MSLFIFIYSFIDSLFSCNVQLVFGDECFVMHMNFFKRSSFLVFFLLFCRVICDSVLSKVFFLLVCSLSTPFSTFQK